MTNPFAWSSSTPAGGNQHNYTKDLTLTILDIEAIFLRLLQNTEVRNPFTKKPFSLQKRLTIRVSVQRYLHKIPGLKCARKKRHNSIHSSTLTLKTVGLRCDFKKKKWQLCSVSSVAASSSGFKGTLHPRADKCLASFM